MKLIPADEDHVLTMLDWFPSALAAHQWAGPKFRFPFSKKSFLEDLKLSDIRSYQLMDGSKLVAFGQCYNRLNRCHLGRLAVAPDRRNQGVGKQLIEKLSEEGKKQLNLSSTSLFVLSDNLAAVALYQHSGFVLENYPKPIPLENCWYMVRDF